jgi:hypothetical protein
MPKEDGIQSIFIPRPVYQFHEVNVPQPPHPRPERAGAIMRGTDSIERPFVFFTRWVDHGQPIMTRPQPRRNLDRGDEGIEAPVPRPFVGWIPVLPDLVRRFVAKGGALPADFSVLTFPLISAAEWALDTTEVIRPRRRLAAAEMEPYLPPLLPLTWGFEDVERLAARRRPRRAVDRWEALSPFSIAVPWGYEAPVTTIARAPRRLLVAAPELIVPARPTVWGFDAGAPIAQRRRPLVLPEAYRYVEKPFPPIWTAGWEVQAWQPPRPRQWRAGALARGIDGTDFRFIVPFREGWAPTLFWPPHPRPERGGAIMLGDLSGAWGIFTYLVPSGAIAMDAPVWIAVPFDIGLPP